MKCLILAAGYATRLYPLTKNFPKPLLTVRDVKTNEEKTILDWLVDDIAEDMEEFIIISNHRYAEQFKSWSLLKQKESNVEFVVLDDGTTENENRLGAVKDIQFAIDSMHISDDLLVAAGDNILDFSLESFLSYARQKKTSCIMRYYEPSMEKLRHCGVVLCDEEDLVLGLEEKPKSPKSHWCCPPFYYYTKEDSALVKAGIEAGCGTDAPGSFNAWLCGKTGVHAMEMPGMRYDIGDIESYEQTKKIFAKKEEKT